MINVKKYSEIIGFISGIVSLIFGIISFLTQLLENQYVVLLVLVGLFFIIQWICKIAIEAKKEILSVITHKYSPKTIRWAKFGKLISYVIWIYPLFLVFVSFSFFTRKCSTGGEIGILITRFSVLSDDDFSYKLFQTLEDKFQTIDSINTIKNTHFINPTNEKFKDSLRKLLDDNCINRGMLVFGKRSEQSKLFDCNIYLHNLPFASAYTLSIRKSDILFLQNPDVLNFSIDDQAAKVAEFIQGLLYSSSEDQELARGCFQRAADIEGFKNNRFISHCMFFIGNSFAKQHNYKESIKYYKNGLKLDSINAYMHFNLGTVLLMSSDSAAAFVEYSLAYRINARFVNPIQNYLSNKPIIPKSTTIPAKKGKEEVRHDQADSMIEGVTDEFRKTSCGDKSGIVDAKLKTILECKFDFVGKIFNYKNHRYFIVGVSNKYGAYDLKGKKIIPIIHRSEDYVSGILKSTIELAPESLTPIKE